MRSFIRSMKNLWVFRKVVWYFRWYDFSFQEEVLDKMLAECEKHWSESHYVGWEFTLGRIRVVRRYYRRYLDSKDIYEEYKWQRRFHKEYARLLVRLWD